MTSRHEAHPMTPDPVIEQLRRRVDPELYRDIRRLWKAHVTAEDARDIPSILTTLTEDCLFEIVQTGQRWQGLDGAARFHAELFTAFPDIRFRLANIVIGPQGVHQEIHVQATFQADWASYRAHGGPVTFTILVLYPWDLRQRKFTGERIYLGSDPSIDR